MGKISKILQNKRDLLENLYGNIDNLIVSKNFNEALPKIAELHKTEQEHAKWKNLKNTLDQTQIGDEELFNTEKKVNYEDPLIKESDAYKKYDEYRNGILQDYLKPVDDVPPGQVNAAGEVTPPVNPPNVLTFQDYIKNDPVLSAEINSKFTTEEKKARDLDEVKKLLYKKAKFSDEDINFYNTYKPPFAEEYNKSLAQRVYENTPALTSRGSLKDSLAQNFAQRVMGNALTDPVEKKKNVQFHDGKMYTFDENNNLLSTESTGKEKKFSLSNDAEMIGFTDDAGNMQYGFFEPDPTANDFGNLGWKFTGVLATQDQIDEKNDTGKYAKKTGTGRSRSYRRKTSGTTDDNSGESEYDKDAVRMLKQFAELKERSSKDWDAFAKNDIGEETADAKKYFELEKILKDRFPNSDIHGLANDIYKQEYKKGKNQKTDTEYLKERIQEEDEYNIAQDNMSGLFKDLYNNILDVWNKDRGPDDKLTAIPRSDEPREMREEIQAIYDTLSDMEKKVVQHNFKQQFGEDLFKK